MSVSEVAAEGKNRVAMGLVGHAALNGTGKIGVDHECYFLVEFTEAEGVHWALD